ncbi:MAG: AbrB/MazE/SpoVT family DNA-binding domain-containing protein [Rubrivivax sp.]|nr:AbrB/MazE/SpoVT family DNA-binding domain-containing protein [Rubrivivax sp.]MDP3611930.1 AbrB/MazE/SpoVT family DNA-binding domain-containing protein [Rubrivivax sp.]
MDTITLSSKGQLVIPKAVRQSANLVPGDVLSVRYVDGEIRLKPVTGVVPTSLAEVAGCLARLGHKPLSQAQTRAAIQARLKARFKAGDAAP